METPLEKALTTMVTTFHKYSGREGSKLTLSRKELKELIKTELSLAEAGLQFSEIPLPLLPECHHAWPGIYIIFNTGNRSAILDLMKKMKESSIDNLMKSLDKNSDQEIDFKEYSVFLTTLCMAYNDFFLEDK